MTALVVYDSVYGNTARIAHAIAEALNVEAQPVGGVTPADIEACTLLVVGSPTQGGRPLPSIATFVANLPADALRSKGAAAFDTRISAADSGFWLRLLIRMIDYAAPRIGRALERKGAQLKAPPEGFIVQGKEGPLRDGEEDRAREWAHALLAVASLSR